MSRNLRSVCDLEELLAWRSGLGAVAYRSGLLEQMPVLQHHVADDEVKNDEKHTNHSAEQQVDDADDDQLANAFKYGWDARVTLQNHGCYADPADTGDDVPYTRNEANQS
ncbi:MAG: hypothetical protein ABI216_13800 [Devosia sp.]